MVLSREVAEDVLVRRIAVVCPETRRLGVDALGGAMRLPRIAIRRDQRLAAQVTQALTDRYGVIGVVLNTAFDAHGPLVIVERIAGTGNGRLTEVCQEKLPASEWHKTSREAIEDLFKAGQKEGHPFSRLGWIETAIAWVEEVTGKSVQPRRGVRHLLAASDYALIEMPVGGRASVWLKATGSPNLHERAVFRVLSQLNRSSQDPPAVPELIGECPAWNAWLMTGDGASLEPGALQAPEMLEEFIDALAGLQIASTSQLVALHEAGAFDQSWSAMASRTGELFDWIAEAMGHQTSIKVPRLSAQRIRELESCVRRALDLGEALDLPAAILHGDLNPGNLVRGTSSRFLDWSEAYLGFPFISLEHLLLLQERHGEDAKDESQFRERYARRWRDAGIPSAALAKGFRIAPLLAPYSSLFGRGLPLDEVTRSDPRRQQMVRTLARHMDRALSNLPEPSQL